MGVHFSSVLTKIEEVKVVGNWPRKFIQPMHKAPLNLGILIGGIGFSTWITDKFVHFFLNSWNYRFSFLIGDSWSTDSCAWRWQPLGRKIGWIFHVFHESLSAMERKPSQDIGQCAFVYFSLKNNVGTTCISISTQGFVENMKISGFSLLKPFFTEKWTSEGAMERKSGQNRLPMYLCVFLIENQCWHSEHVDQHRRRFTFLWKNGFKREKLPGFHGFRRVLKCYGEKIQWK